jgi:rSAM/selenodomain-associated transferase 1
VPASSHPVTLGLMTKYWEAGEVKTRLGASIGRVRAAQIHRLFVIHLCKSLRRFAGRRVVCLAPTARINSLRDELRAHDVDRAWNIVPQADGDLGDRMMDWFESTFADPLHPTRGAILIGSDCPLISPSTLEESERALKSHDAVVGPAVDGGYYLIGLSATVSRCAWRSVFDRIPWSSDRVMETTRTRLAAADLSWHELPLREDIDTIVELNRLRSELAAHQEECPPSLRSEAEATDLLTAINDILEEETEQSTSTG